MQIKRTVIIMICRKKQGSWKLCDYKHGIPIYGYPVLSLRTQREYEREYVYDAINHEKEDTLPRVSAAFWIARISRFRQKMVVLHSPLSPLEESDLYKISSILL
jgi:hypothetical protein